MVCLRSAAQHDQPDASLHKVALLEHSVPEEYSTAASVCCMPVHMAQQHHCVIVRRWVAAQQH